MIKSLQSKNESGVKYDAGKARLDLIPPHALLELGNVYLYGAVLYEDRNWEKGMSWSRILGAGLRHIFKFMASILHAIILIANA